MNLTLTRGVVLLKRMCGAKFTPLFCIHSKSHWLLPCVLPDLIYVEGDSYFIYHLHCFPPAQPTSVSMRVFARLVWTVLVRQWSKINSSSRRDPARCDGEELAVCIH